ncbi:MAG: PD-(D/E)XK nuclease family protein, partial [Candidatus Gallimonas sp.]
MTSVIGAPTLDDALAVLCDRAEQAERRGEKNLIFCEDRLTLLVERALLKRLGGTFLTEVTTFARFLTGSARVLSKQGSVMELSALIAEHRSELVCFGTGSAQAVYETVAQLSASRVTADALRAGAEETEGALRGKLLDLAFLQEKYVAFLREKNVTDENGYLALLPDAIERGRLGEVNLYFFGFPSFTRQAREGVRAAVENGKSVTGIFVAGRASCYTNEGARCFRKILEEYGDARSYMAQDTLTGDALALRDGMFSPERFSLPPQNATGVRAFAAEDEESELRTVAALIRKAVFGGLRYRDTAVLVSDESVFPVAERVFRAHGIPFFADKKRALSEHPFCVFALDLLEAVSDGVLPAEADAIASNYYFGGGDEYRNYLLKFGGFRGAMKREIKEGEAVKRYDVPALRASREKMLRLIGVFPKKGKGRAFTDGVRELYRLVGGDETTERLAESFTGAEKQFLSLAPLDGILSEIDEVSGERTFTSREFATMLKSGA